MENKKSTVHVSPAKQALLLPLIDKGMRADEIYGALPGVFKSIQGVRVVISHLRKAGVVSREVNRKLEPWSFSLTGLGEDLWGKLMAASQARYQTPWDLAKDLLKVLLDEPILMTNLLDEEDQRDAA